MTKHDNSKPMGCSKSSSKREVYSNTILPQEIKKKKNSRNNDNENMTTQSLWDAAKAVLRGKFIAIQSYLKKQEKHQIYNLTLHLKQLENARVTAGPKRPHLGVCPGPNIPLQGRQGSRGCIPGSPIPGILQARTLEWVAISFSSV